MHIYIANKMDLCIYIANKVDLCIYIANKVDLCIYIANKEEPTGRCWIHYRAPVGYTVELQLSSEMYFYFIFYCDKNNHGS